MRSIDRSSIGTQLCLLMLLGSAGHVSAHHSTAHIDKESTIEIRGTVVSYNYRNPHVHLVVEGVDESGQLRRLSFEMQSPAYLRRYGWDRQTWQAGDEVVAIGHPSKNVDSAMSEGLQFTNATGEIFTTRAADENFVAGVLVNREEDLARVPAERMEGVWELGHVDGRVGSPPFINARRTPELHERFSNAHPAMWPFLHVLNDLSRDALNEFSREAPDNPWCTPDPWFLSHFLEPTLMNLMLEDDQLTFQRADEEFAVHFEAEHPPTDQKFAWGHAIGEWDGDTLLIDVANFAPNPWGLGRGVPSGIQKSVQHRISWADDRTMLYMSTTVFDPEYMTESLTLESRWVHAPQRELDVTEPCSEDSGNLYLQEEFGSI